MLKNFVLMMLVVCISACTNNGDIGPLYGLWAMDGCTVDGADADEAGYRDFYWRFQGEIVAINETIGAHEHLEWVGTYAQTDEGLQIDFSEGEVDTDFNPARIGLVAGKMDMQVLSISGSRLVMTYVSPSGDTWRYTLRKLD